MCTNDSFIFDIIKKDLEDYLGYFGVSTNVVLLIFLIILLLSCISNLTLIAEQDSGSNRSNRANSTRRTVEDVNHRTQPPAYHVIMRNDQS